MQRVGSRFYGAERILKRIPMKSDKVTANEAHNSAKLRALLVFGASCT